MNTDKILKIQAYLDNELSSDEARQIATWLDRDPEARSLFHELRDIKSAIVGNEVSLAVPESREFYWSKIKRSIEAEPIEIVHPPIFARWLRWATPFAAAAATIALLVSFTAFDLPGLRLKVAVHEIDDSQEEDSSITFHSQAEGMTVVWIPSGH